MPATTHAAAPVGVEPSFLGGFLGRLPAECMTIALAGQSPVIAYVLAGDALERVFDPLAAAGGPADQFEVDTGYFHDRAQTRRDFAGHGRQPKFLTHFGGHREGVERPGGHYMLEEAASVQGVPGAVRALCAIENQAVVMEEGKSVAVVEMPKRRDHERRGLCTLAAGRPSGLRDLLLQPAQHCGDGLLVRPLNDPLSVFVSQCPKNDQACLRPKYEVECEQRVLFPFLNLFD